MELIINIFSLVGSLALFLFGMKTMSEGLEKFAGDRLRSILAAMTKNRVMGVLTGVLITALIQSSSAAPLVDAVEAFEDVLQMLRPSPFPAAQILLFPENEE